MKRLASAALLTCALLAVPGTHANGAIAHTATGIALDAPWKVTVYEMVHARFRHPGWGWQHSERDYQLAVEVAQGDGLKIDTDVLFAAAMLHDMAAFPPYEKAGMEHGDRAAETSEAVLRDAGFPMRKFPAVQAAMHGHMYYSEAGSVPEAIALHDADSLDFLGVVGATRILALTGSDKADVQPALKTLRKFVAEIPPRLITRTAKRMGATRAAELSALLAHLEAETYNDTI
jgi:uncharacterized protein